MDQIDRLQKLYLEKISQIEIREFREYSLRHLLFNETYFVQKVTKKQLIVNFLLTVFTDRPLINIGGCEKDFVMLSLKYDRRDHSNYWESICNLFADRYRIDILPYKSLHSVLKNIDIKNVLKKIRLYKRIQSQLTTIENKKHRAYFALQLVNLKVFEYKIDDLQLNPKVFMTFFDSGFYEAMAVQYFKKRGTITFTNQHGQPVFRSWEEDRLNQSQILNFNCDYFLAKGEFTRKQFINAGFDSKSVIVVGNMNHRTQILENKGKKCIGVFLDCPTLSFAQSVNEHMIDFANRISEEMGLEYCLKLHPQDCAEKYETLVSSRCSEIYDKSVGLEEVFNAIDVGIIHASAVYLDLIDSNIKAFRLETENEFPLVEEENDLFEDIQDFKIKYIWWNEQPIEKKAEYMDKIQKKYNGVGDANKKILDALKEYT